MGGPFLFQYTSCYIPQPDGLRKGDRIRITEGRFKGVEATVVIQPGAGRKDVMVCVENWMWVPLLRVMPGEYEVIALNDEDKHVYTRLDNDCMLKWFAQCSSALSQCGGGE